MNAAPQDVLASLPMGTSLVIYSDGSWSRWLRDFYGQICMGAELFPHKQRELAPQIDWHLRRGENIVDQRVRIGGAA